MKKILKTGINIGIYSMLLWSAFSAYYITSPELQALLPNFTTYSAVISGGSTFLLGSGGLFFMNLANKVKVETADKFAIIAKNFLDFKTENREDSIKILTAIESLQKDVRRNNQLIEVDLKSKLSNPLIDEEVKSLIEGVLDVKEE